MELAGETQRGGHYGVVITDGNGVTQNKRITARVGRSQVNVLPKETERVCGIHISTLNIWSGRAA